MPDPPLVHLDMGSQLELEGFASLARTGCGWWSKPVHMTRRVEEVTCAACQTRSDRAG